MGEDPRDIQERIAQTREQMGDTVDALASKADVPGRVRGAVAEKKDAALGKTGNLAGQARSGARRGAGLAQENPLGLALGAVAAGFVAGMLIPSTRVEDERLGPVADSVKQQAREVGSDAADHAKQIAQDVAETVKEEGSQHAEELRESVTGSNR